MEALSDLQLERPMLISRLRQADIDDGEENTCRENID